MKAREAAERYLNEDFSDEEVREATVDLVEGMMIEADYDGKISAEEVAENPNSRKYEAFREKYEEEAFPRDGALENLEDQAVWNLLAQRLEDAEFEQGRRLMVDRNDSEGYAIAFLTEEHTGYEDEGLEGRRVEFRFTDDYGFPLEEFDGYPTEFNVKRGASINDISVERDASADMEEVEQDVLNSKDEVEISGRVEDVEVSIPGGRIVYTPEPNRKRHIYRAVLAADEMTPEVQEALDEAGI